MKLASTLAVIAIYLAGCDSNIPGWSASSDNLQSKNNSITHQDKDGNGVRDDIDTQIANSSRQDNILKTRYLYAKVLQQVADFDFENPREIPILKSEYTKRLACVMLVDDGFVEVVNDMTFNTPALQEQQQIFEKSLSGQMFDFGALAKLC